MAIGFSPRSLLSPGAAATSPTTEAPAVTPPGPHLPNIDLRALGALGLGWGGALWTVSQALLPLGAIGAPVDASTAARLGTMPRGVGGAPIEWVSPAARVIGGPYYLGVHDASMDGALSVLTPGRVPDGFVMSVTPLLEAPDMAAFLADHVQYVPPGAQPERALIRLALPGLNTPEAEAGRRARGYADVLGLPLSEMHLGTKMDQGDLVIGPGRPDTFNLTVPADKRDWVAAAIERAGRTDTRAIRNLTAVLEANLSKAQPQQMELWGYSRSSITVGEALNRYTSAEIDRRASLPGAPDRASIRAEVEAHLREYVTVLTVGNGYANYPDGPRYVHAYATGQNPDPVTSRVGVREDAPQGAGRDAVFVPYESPWPGFESHNFGAVGVQAIHVTLIKNGVRTPGELWARGQQAPIARAELAEIEAEIARTHGANELWTLEVGPDGVLRPR